MITVIKIVSFLSFVIPFISFTQNSGVADVQILKIQDVGEPVHFDYPLELSNYHLCGQLEEVGMGHVDVNTGFFAISLPI